MSIGREIHLTENPDGQWTARDEEVGISAQGASRAAALDALDDVVGAVTGDGGHEPTEEELRDLSVDPETARTQGEKLPDALR
jgi:predicted RNase H-like HicB family nuclease